MIGLLIGYSIGIGPNLAGHNDRLPSKIGFPSYKQLNSPCYVVQTHFWISAYVSSVTDGFPQLKEQSLVTPEATKQFVIENGAAAAVNNGPSYVFLAEDVR
jgi:hypothetical protein